MKKLFIAILVFSNAFLYAQTVQRKAVFTKGEQLQKVSDIKFTNSLSMMGQDIATNTSTTLITIYKITNVTDKSYQIEIMVKSLVTDITSAGQQMSYNSDKAEDSSSAVGQVLKNMIGKTTNITVDKNGIITSIDTTGGQGQLNEMTSSMMMTGNDMEVGKSFELVGDLPAKGIQKGTSWIDSSGMSDSEKNITNYSVQSVANNHAVVLFNGTKKQMGTTEQNGMSITTDLTGKVNGQFEMDTNTGTITNKLTNVNLSGTLTMMGATSPTTSTISVTETITKL